MPRNADSPHRIHEARRPAHISDGLADKTVAALTDIAHGDRLRSRSRSRESSDSAGAVIDRLIAETRVSSSARDSDQPAAAVTVPWHDRSGGGNRLAGAAILGASPGESSPSDRGGRAYGSRLAAQDAHRDENRTPEPPGVVQARLRRSAIVPRVLTVPCPEHNAEVGKHCYENPFGVCWRRVQAKAAKP